MSRRMSSTEVYFSFACFWQFRRVVCFVVICFPVIGLKIKWFPMSYVVCVSLTSILLYLPLRTLLPFLIALSYFSILLEICFDKSWSKLISHTQNFTQISKLRSPQWQTFGNGVLNKLQTYVWEHTRIKRCPTRFNMNIVYHGNVTGNPQFSLL